jgi:hypothetical protein
MTFTSVVNYRSHQMRDSRIKPNGGGGRERPLRPTRMPRAPGLDVPARRHAERAPISQHRRLALIHRFLTDKRIELRTRVAGCLLLLYPQPVSRLARLTLDDIITGDDGQVFIRLGDPRCSPNWPPTA